MAKVQNNFKALEKDVLANIPEYIKMGSVYLFEDTPISTPINIEQVFSERLKKPIETKTKKAAVPNEEIVNPEKRSSSLPPAESSIREPAKSSNEYEKNRSNPPKRDISYISDNEIDDNLGFDGNQPDNDVVSASQCTLNVLLTDLQSQLNELMDQIKKRIIQNPRDNEIDQLKSRRRGIWEQIEMIELEMQSQSTSPNGWIVPDNIQNRTENKNGDTQEILNEKNAMSFSSSKDHLTHSDLSESDDDIIPLYPPVKNVQIDPQMEKTMIEVNKKVFHHSQFRGIQMDAIAAALQGHDVFVIMPTGGGKSLCYQLTGYIQKGLTVVISPLISLIHDQVRALSELNISACPLNAETTKAEFTAMADMIRKDRLRFLFLTPEKLMGGSSIQSLLFDEYQKRKSITRFVVDEAHCVSQWGHDFRKDYTQLGLIRQKFRGVPIMALTATATSSVKMDIVKQLDISDCKFFQQSFNRPNLHYEVMKKEGSTLQSYGLLLKWIIDHKYKESCGLVFCLTTSDTEKVSSWLNEQGLSSAFYHAQMDPHDRHQVQVNWTQNNVRIIVATLAFGMGIDKPDVRFVIHHTMPKSLEEYYQESGRAGRDGLISRCLLMFNIGDKAKISRLISMDKNGEKKSRNRLEIEMQMLSTMSEYGLEQLKCRRVMVLSYFDEEFDKRNCNGTCDNCIRSLTASSKCEIVDLTNHLENMANLIHEINNSRKRSPWPTSIYLISVYSGNRLKKIVDCGDSDLPQFGLGSELKGIKQTRIHKVLQELLDRKIVKLAKRHSKHGVIQFYSPGPEYQKSVKKGFEPYIIQEYVVDDTDGFNEHEINMFKEINEYRNELSSVINETPDSLLPIPSIRLIVQSKPKTIAELKKIKGMFKSKNEAHYQALIDILMKNDSKPQPKLNIQSEKPRTQSNPTIGKSPYFSEPTIKKLNKVDYPIPTKTPPSPQKNNDILNPESIAEMIKSNPDIIMTFAKKMSDFFSDNTKTGIL